MCPHKSFEAVPRARLVLRTTEKATLPACQRTGYAYRMDAEGIALDKRSTEDDKDTTRVGWRRSAE